MGWGGVEWGGREKLCISDCKKCLQPYACCLLILMICSAYVYRINWKPAKASSTVQSGDVISCSGMGRVKVEEVSTTKKGRFAVNLVRYT